MAYGESSHGRIAPVVGSVRLIAGIAPLTGDCDKELLHG